MLLFDELFEALNDIITEPLQYNVRCIKMANFLIQITYKFNLKSISVVQESKRQILNSKFLL